MNLPAIIAHGGAGAWKDDRLPDGMHHVERASRIGFGALISGSTAMDAAEMCTRYMEGCGKLNAGVGATKNSDGELELDAMIVDGVRLRSGLVVAARGVEYPVSLARYVLEKTDHMVFVGEGLQRLYKRMLDEGFREGWDKTNATSLSGGLSGDTVGCVTVDKSGNIACTSSTGGIRDKMPGRVGDSPILGAGAYANKICGATATGYGEHIIRVTLSRMVVLYVENGAGVQEAAERGMAMFASETGSEAGIVVADRHGNVGHCTNAKAMPVASIQGSLKSLFTTTSLKA